MNRQDNPEVIPFFHTYEEELHQGSRKGYKYNKLLYKKNWKTIRSNLPWKFNDPDLPDTEGIDLDSLIF